MWLHSKGHHKESGQQLVQSLDGIQQTYEQTLHGVRTLGADELKDSSVDQHVGERRQDQRNNEGMKGFAEESQSCCIIALQGLCRDETAVCQC